MITTIVLPVSRREYLERVITSLEWLKCNADETNILAIVDGDDALYLRVRNLINGSKFNKRLTVKADIKGPVSRLDVPSRRKRITAIHNQARELIEHDVGYVFLVEDDTTFGPSTLAQLQRVADLNRASGMVIGVELARWGTPYLGAWTADDVYETKVLKTVENITPVPVDLKPTRIDAGGLYCALVRADMYRQYNFHCDNGLGPDVNFGLALRQLGYENYIVWQVQCAHYNHVLGKEVKITPDQESKQVTLTKIKDKKWHIDY